MSDTYKSIICPACGASMKKIFIPSAGINIDICSESCGGLFFDNQELQKFNKSSDDISEIKNILEGKTFVSVDENKTRTCPSCEKPMVKTNIKGLNVQIDTCYTCGGVFLDNGELDTIRQGVKKTTVNDLKTQNNELKEDTVRDFYKAAQQEEALRNRNMMMAEVLFGRRRNGLWGRKSHGLIDIIFAILR